MQQKYQQRPSKRTAIHARVDPPLVKDVDDWRRKQPTIPARSAAICELLRRALLAEAKPA
jgi:hypothetical protein